MTETQAKSGSAGTSANPVDEEVADGSATATGRAAVGRAAVPADGPSPKFTRASGMPPPPDQPPTDADGDGRPVGSTTESAGSAAGTSAGGPDRTKSDRTVADNTVADHAVSDRTVSDRAASNRAVSDRAVSDRVTSDGRPTGVGRPGASTGSGRAVTNPNGPVNSVGATDAANATVPIRSGTKPSGSDQQGGVGAQAKAAAQSVIGLARSAGLGRFSPDGRTATRPDGGSPRTDGGSPRTGVGSASVSGTAATRPGTARTTALRPPGTPPGASAVGAARVTEAVRAARSTVGSAASRGPRRARLNVKRIDPWSVMKFSFAVSLVLFIVVIVATSVLYLALDAMGVFESVNSSLTDLVSASGGQGADTFKITAKGVILTSALIGLINVVLFTALATLGAFIYNVCADLVGGIELTLAERD